MYIFLSHSFSLMAQVLIQNNLSYGTQYSLLLFLHVHCKSFFCLPKALDCDDWLVRAGAAPEVWTV